MSRYKLVKNAELTLVGVRVNDTTHPTLAYGTFIPIDSTNWGDYLTWAGSNTADAASVTDFMGLIRIELDQRIADSDWTQEPDAPLTPEEKAAWNNYRQEVRNIMMNKSVLVSVQQYNALVWPNTP